GRQAGQSRRPAGQSRRPATITAVPTPSAIALVPVRSSGAYPWIALLGLIPSGGEIVPSWIKRSTRADDDVAGDNPVRKRLLQCRRSFTEDGNQHAVGTLGHQIIGELKAVMHATDDEV